MARFRQGIAGVAAAMALAAGLGTVAVAFADELVTPDEFEAMSEGRTLYFSRDGGEYGAEQYLEGRQVIWQYADGTCADGFWYQKAEALCFVYENDPVPQCWLFSRRKGEFFARLADTPADASSELRLSRNTEEPLMCPGPDTGV